MYISRLDWDDYRIEHIAQHNVEPDEVWEVCEDPLHLARRQGHNRYRVYGQTADIDFHILNFTALSVVGVLQYSLLPLAL
jgi:uncharacterized DUF497 family protein